MWGHRYNYRARLRSSQRKAKDSSLVLVEAAAAGWAADGLFKETKSMV